MAVSLVRRMKIIVILACFVSTFLVLKVNADKEPHEDIKENDMVIMSMLE